MGRAICISAEQWTPPRCAVGKERGTCYAELSHNGKKELQRRPGVSQLAALHCAFIHSLNGSVRQMISDPRLM